MYSHAIHRKSGLIYMIFNLFPNAIAHVSCILCKMATKFCIYVSSNTHCKKTK